MPSRCIKTIYKGDNKRALINQPRHLTSYLLRRSKQTKGIIHRQIPTNQNIKINKIQDIRDKLS
jgi:hypothetical protein